MTPLEVDTLRARIVVGTGHRPDKLGGFEPAAMKKLRDFADQLIADVRPSKVISGMAMGWDQALAFAAGANGIPFIAAVPFKGQESRWTDDARKLYDLLLSHAEEVVYVCGPGYAGYKMQRRNKWMVEHGDAVLALWDGSSGGTRNCVEYTESVDKPLVNVWNDFERYGK